MDMVLEILSKFATGAGGAAVGLGVNWWLEHHRAKKALTDGDLSGEVLVVANVVEDIDGVPYLKPRTVKHERPIKDYFSNPALIRDIIAATARATEEDPETQLIVLSDKRKQGRLMKRVVNIASEQGAPGHIRRMFRRSFEKNDAYVCVNYAQAGEDDWIIRIDIISAEDLKRFLGSGFVERLSYRPEEGSHADNARIFAFCAHKQFGGPDGGPTADARMYVRRVAIPTLR